MRQALPEIGIIGVGGVVSGETAAELMLAGANAVQVGTANFANPRAAFFISTSLKFDLPLAISRTTWDISQRNEYA